MVRDYGGSSGVWRETQDFSFILKIEQSRLAVRLDVGEGEGPGWSQGFGSSCRVKGGATGTIYLAGESGVESRVGN